MWISRSILLGLLRSPQLCCEIDSILIGKRIGTWASLPVSGSLPFTFSGISNSNGTHFIVLPSAGRLNEKLFVLASWRLRPMPQLLVFAARTQPVIFTTLPGSVRDFGLALHPPKA